MPAVIIWAGGPTFSASEQSPIFTPRQVTCFHPGLERGVPELLHPPGALPCPAWLQLAHKWVGVELRLYATQEIWWGGDPGRTWPRICVRQWGWKADLKMMMVMVMTILAAFLGCFWGCSVLCNSFKWLHVTLPWEGADLQP